MTEKGYKVLKALTTSFPHLVTGVVSARDPNILRDYYDEIKKFCDEKKIPFWDRQKMEEISSDFSIAVSWRWLINLTSTKLIVFHDSLLPQYRGFSPLVSALINGEKWIGVTTFFATKEYDQGDIIAVSKTSITYPIKIQKAIEILTKKYEELAIEIGKKILRGEPITGIKQDESKASYSLWRDEEDYMIDWQMCAERIKRFIDAVGFPYKGAMSRIEDREVRILDAEVLNDVQIVNRTPGKVIFIKNECPVVVCGKGLLMITRIVDDKTGNSLLPFKKIRVRFK
jgi:methionyl-tRNA formyltransferase